MQKRSFALRTLGTSMALTLGSLLFAPPVWAQVAFQPGFHQALRASVKTSTRTTYRIKIPIGRGGSRVRISFTAGDGSLTLHSATIALAGSSGRLASTPVALSFNGAAGFSAGARGRITSDPVPFPVSFGNELYVSFDVDGAMAASNINAFPDSYAYAGGVSGTQSPAAGRPFMQAAAVDTIDVEGPPGLAMVALGDSITEGYVSGDTGAYVSRNDDTRNAWPAVAQGLLGVPVVNAAVSGQGVFDATSALQAEVLTMQGITDCLFLIGTNDLGGSTTAQITAGLATLFDRLRPFCRLWAGTLLPKDRTSNGDYATVTTRRNQVNAWIRQQAHVDGVIDFEPMLAQAGNVNLFAAGMGEDGIHPTIAGHRLMGQGAARVLSPLAPSRPQIEAVQPPAGSFSGGTTISLTGANFAAGATVTVGGLPALRVQVSSSGSLTATTAAHDAGTADIVVTNPDGQSAILPAGFSYVAAADAQIDPPSAAAPETFPISGGCSGSGSNASFLVLIPALLFAAQATQRRRRGSQAGTARR